MPTPILAVLQQLTPMIPECAAMPQCIYSSSRKEGKKWQGKGKREKGKGKREKGKGKVKRGMAMPKPIPVYEKLTAKKYLPHSNHLNISIFYVFTTALFTGAFLLQ
jgi:hypothetical protein